VRASQKNPLRYGLLVVRSKDGKNLQPKTKRTLKSASCPERHIYSVSQNPRAILF